MNDINSCYCFGANMCADCSKIVKWDPEEDFYSLRDPIVDYMETRMADAEMGDL